MLNCQRVLLFALLTLMTVLIVYITYIDWTVPWFNSGTFYCKINACSSLWNWVHLSGNTPHSLKYIFKIKYIINKDLGAPFVKIK